MSAGTLRAWQREALPLCLEAIRTSRRGIVSAVMGAGKSILIAEILAQLWDEQSQTVDVITTPTIRLVDQLATTLRRRLGEESVGRYYTHAHELRRVIVCCTASAGSLAAQLATEKVCVRLWIADEVHKTAAAEISEAVVFFDPAWRLGMTATPYRADERETIQHFNEVVYTYTPEQAMASRDADGVPDVLVPYRPVRWTGADTPLDDACLSMIAGLGTDAGPGLANALTIEDATEFARKLNAAGIPADAIHSRLSRDQQGYLLRHLERGDLRCLVHVSLLAEGVDFPWLRWICLRRAVGSRVRFAQELGRVLRAYPRGGKTHADVLDPNDLFGVFGLSYEAALGWAEPASAPTPQEREEPVDGREPGRARVVRRIDELEWYVRRLALAAQAGGHIVEGVARGAWCRRPATDRQVQALRSMAWRASGADWRTWIRTVCLSDTALTSGAASDLFGLLKISDRRWEPSEPIELPAVEGLLAAITEESAADRRCYIAVARRGTSTAMVALARGRIVASEREADAGSTRAVYSLAVREARNRGLDPVLPESEYLPRGIAGEYATIPQKDHHAVAAAWRLLGAR